MRSILCLGEQAQEGRTTVLIVDEAHNLEWEVLEEIRLLGNLENRRGKLIQVVFAGQPELDRKLDAPNLRQLKQRIVLRCSLEPFDLAQTTEYINTRMAKGGMVGSAGDSSRLDRGRASPRSRHTASDQRHLR